MSITYKFWIWQNIVYIGRNISEFGFKGYSRIIIAFGAQNFTELWHFENFELSFCKKNSKVQPPLLAWFSKSYCQRKPWYYSLSTKGGWGGRYQQNQYWGPRTSKCQFFAMSDIYFYSIFSPNIKFIYTAWYGPKSVQSCQSTQFSGGLDIYEWGWTGVKIQLCSNLGEGMLRGQKRKICPFLSQSTENQKLYNISKNQPIKSVRKEDMGFLLLFDLKKVLFLPYLPSKLSCEV